MSKKKPTVPDNAVDPNGMNPEAEIFGDTSRDPMPVRAEDSQDDFTGMNEEVPVEDVPQVMPVVEVTEEQLFGDTARQEGRATGEQMVTVPMSVLEQMQKDIAELRKNDTDNIIDPLAMGPKKKELNATFYTDDEGKQWLVTDMMERVFPNGDRARTWQDGVDQDKRPITKAILKVVDLETDVSKNVEVIYENFIKLSTPMKVEATNTINTPVDMTPMEESVEITTYQENGNYIRRVGSGVMVRTSVVGVQQRFDIALNGKTYQVSSDVVNIK